MPISGEYTWSETNDTIEVVIPLKGVSPKKVDVFTACNILKVSYAPFLLDLNLYHEINEDKSRAVLKNGTLKICLFKKDAGQLWKCLCFEGTKDEIRQRRSKALKERDEQVRQRMEKVASKKVEEERMVFQQHMALEERERQRLDDIKANEKKNAENAMYDTFTRKQLQATKHNAKLTTTEKQESEVLQLPAGVSTDTDTALLNQDLPQDCSEEVDGNISELDNNNDMLPPPRNVVQSTFKHTPRLFKTPSRESTIKQEQEFIMKNRSNLKKNVLLNSVDIGDADPVWLNSKGDEFYSKGDFCSAINAYSEALNADETMVHTLGNRAACYLHLREGSCCIKDCLAVLKMNESIDAHFDMDVEKKQFRKSTHIRLALAYCLVDEYESGMKHFTIAQELDESDEVALESIQYLETLMEATQWKTKADESFASGDLAKANECYSTALTVDPTLTKALMNRAACHLAMDNCSDCIDDRTLALSQCKQKHCNPSLLAAILFPKPNVQRKWIVTLLCRRAAARQQLGKDYQGAIADLEEAKQIIRPSDDIDLGAVEKSIECLKKERMMVA